MPEEIAERAKLDTAVRRVLMRANDNGTPFSVIADFIEKHL